MYLGLDLGTTNVKAVVVDRRRPSLGRRLGAGRALSARPAAASSRTSSRSGRPRARRSAAAPTTGRDAPADSRPSASPARAGPCNCSTPHGQPVGPVISWLDGRGRPYDERLTRNWGDDFLVEHLGRAPAPWRPGSCSGSASGSSRNFGRSAAGVGFVGDVIVGRLCGRRAHDATSLSIAMLFNPWLERADPDISGPAWA